MVRRLKYVKFVLFNLALILPLSCYFGIKPIYNSEQRRVASEEVRRFHSLLNDRKYEDLYKMTSARARTHKKKEDFVTMTRKMHRHFGVVKTSVLITSKEIARVGFTEVTISYRTQFEKDERREEFVWDVKNGRAKLFSYSVY